MKRYCTCKKRARFRVARRWKADNDHILCSRCYRALVDQVVAAKKKVHGGWRILISLQELREQRELAS